MHNCIGDMRTTIITARVGDHYISPFPQSKFALKDVVVNSLLKRLNNVGYCASR